MHVKLAIDAFNYDIGFDMIWYDIYILLEN